MHADLKQNEAYNKTLLNASLIQRALLDTQASLKMISFIFPLIATLHHVQYCAGHVPENPIDASNGKPSS